MTQTTRTSRACLAALGAALALTVTAAPAAQGQAAPNPPDAARKALVERGRYLVRTSGCNDCHTPGYANAAGKVDETLWLTGDALGWNGPWGTTYPSNLRLYMQGQTEASWLKTARSFEARPPMPWFNVRAMTDADLRALYHYIRSLEPLGKPAPAYVPPGTRPNGPVIQFPG